MVFKRTSGLGRATLFSVGGAGIYGISLILMDVAIAHRYGTGTQAAVYQAAYMIPTLLIGMFSGGAVLGAFVPIFIRLGGQSRQAAADLFLRSTAGLLLTILTPLAALLIWAAPLLAETIASGFSLAERKELINTLRLVSHWKQPAQVVKGATEPATVLTSTEQWAQIPDLTHRMMYLDTVTRQLRYEISWNLRGVGERLVV